MKPHIEEAWRSLRLADRDILAQLLRGRDAITPLSDDDLRRLNPFAVTFRYDDMEIERINRQDVANWVAGIRRWAEEQVSAATESEEPDGGEIV